MHIEKCLKLLSVFPCFSLSVCTFYMELNNFNITQGTSWKQEIVLDLYFDFNKEKFKTVNCKMIAVSKCHNSALVHLRNYLP